MDINRFCSTLILCISLGYNPAVVHAGSKYPNGKFVEMGVSCNEQTSKDNKIIMQYLPIQRHPPLCIDRSSIVRDILVKSTKISFYENTNSWWLIINFPESAAFMITSITSRNVGRELAIIRNGKIVTSGLIGGPISEPMYSTSLVSEAEGKEIEAVISR